MGFVTNMRYAICIMFNDVHLKRFVSYVGSSLCNYALLRSKVQLKAAHTTNKQKTNKQTYTHNKQTNTQTTSNYHIPKHIHILKHNTVLSSPIHFYSPVKGHTRLFGNFSQMAEPPPPFGNPLLKNPETGNTRPV